jgi:hypothetical protein
MAIIIIYLNMDLILFGSFSHVTIKWIQEQDVVLFGNPSHVTMMMKVDPSAEKRGGDINQGKLYQSDM